MTVSNQTYSKHELYGKMFYSWNFELLKMYYNWIFEKIRSCNYKTFSISRNFNYKTFGTMTVLNNVLYRKCFIVEISRYWKCFIIEFSVSCFTSQSWRLRFSRLSSSVNFIAIFRQVMAKSLISRFLILSAPIVRSSSENAKQKVSHDSWSDWLKQIFRNYILGWFHANFFLQKKSRIWIFENFWKKSLDRTMVRIPKFRKKFETYPSVRIYVHSSSLSCWVTNPCSSRSFWICEFNSGSSMRESFHSSRRRFKTNFNCWAIFLIRGPLVCWRLWRY